MSRRKHSWAERWLFLEAVAGLIAARLALRTTSFRTVLRWLGMEEVSADASHAPGDRQRVQLIGWAVGAAAARLPWKSTCLMEALAGAALLRRHGLPGTLSLGVGTSTGPGTTLLAEVTRTEEDALAHAWLRCGEVVLTGEAERARFEELVSFGLP